MDKEEAIKILDKFDFSETLDDMRSSHEVLTTKDIRTNLRYYDYIDDDDDYEESQEIRSTLPYLKDKELMDYLSNRYNVNFVEIKQFDIPVDHVEKVHKYE